MGAADLEISLRSWGGDAYAAEARFTVAPGAPEAALLRGPPANVPLDPDALLAVAHDPDAYAERLTAMLFADPRLGAALATAVAQAQAANVPLRLRLRLDAADDLVHALRWEHLRAPGENYPLAASERILLSRYLESADLTPVVPRPRDALTALVAVAVPTNLADYRLAPIDAAAEVARITRALNPVPATVLARAGTGRPVTLAALAEALRAGPDILCLVCHGTLRQGRAVLWLEQEDGSAERVAGDEFAGRINALPRRPALVVLMACESAGGDPGDGPLAAVGPRLAAAGVPAVLAAQGALSAATAAEFMAVFFRELLRDGLIDRATAAARAALLHRPDWWAPALFLRLRDGLLWGQPEGPPAPAAPPAINVQVAGNVYGQLIVSAGDVTTIASPVVPSLRQLPAPVADFVGRDDEVAALVAALQPAPGEVGLAAICGMGGLGKTELALRVARDLAAAYPDAQLFVPLGGASEEGPREVSDALRGAIRAFDPNAALPDDAAALAALYRGHLAGRRALVLVDDAPDSAAARAFIPPTGCALLVTSRSQVWFRGQGAVVNLGLLTREQARRLLLDDAPALAGDPALDPLLERCGDLPLAVRVAAATLAAGLSPADYLARLADERRRLRAFRFDDLDVFSVLGVSEELLAQDDSALARRWLMLGICPAPFDAATAAAIWDDVDPDAATDSLERLARRSLLRRDAATGRYTMHDLLRDLAGARRAPADGLTGRLRHAGHFVAALRAAQAGYARGHDAALDGLRLLDESWPHLVAATGWLLASPGPEADRLLIDALVGAPILALRLTPRELERWGAAAAAAARRQGDRAGEADARAGRAEGALLAGELDEAAAEFAAALDAFRVLGDGPGELRALLGLAEAWRLLGRYPDAEAELRRAVALAETAGDSTARAHAHAGLGGLLAHTSSYDEAVALLTRARDEFTRLGDRSGLSRTLEHLGFVHQRRNDYEQAIVVAEEKLALAAEQGDQIMTGVALNTLGVAYWRRGDLERGRRYLQEQLAAAERIGYPRGISVAHGDLAGICADERDYPAAIGHLEQAMAAAQAMGDHSGVGVILGNAGSLYARCGNLDAALACLGAALAIVVELGEWLETPYLFLALADTLRARGDTARAGQLYAHTAELARAVATPAYLGDALHQLADLAAQEGRLAEALQLNDEALLAMAEPDYGAPMAAAQILDVTLRARLGRLAPAEARAALDMLLAEREAPWERAEILLARWRLDPSDEPGRQAAAALLRELYARSPDALYRRRYEELGFAGLAPPEPLPVPASLAGTAPPDLEALIQRAVATSRAELIDRQGENGG